MDIIPSGIIRVLALVTTGTLLFLMIGLPLCTEEVFVTRSIIEGVELLFAFAFLSVFLFLIVTLIHLVRRATGRKEFTAFETGMLIVGTLCLLGLAGQKVMLDEIAREMAFGIAWRGEFIILNVVFILQLGYALGFVFRRHEEPGNPITPAG